MKSTRNVMEQMNANVNESIGIRTAEHRPSLSPVASERDIGRRANRAFGQIAIDRIQPDPDQPRVEFDEEALGQLADSIRERGQLAPIRVRWSDSHSKWLIISGERRWRAANRAGLKTVDCYFQEQVLSPTQILEEQLIENLLRQDLRPIEEAESFQRLMQVNHWNGKQLAMALSISPTRVSRTLALLKLPHEMRVRVDAGELSARAGYEFSKLPEPQLAKVVSAEQPVTAADAARVVRQRKGKEKPADRGTHQTFFADNGWKVIVRCPRKGTYSEIEQALFIALEEVQLRIKNRVKL